MDTNLLVTSAEDQLKSFGTFLDYHDKSLNKFLRQPLFNNSTSLVLQPIIQIEYGTSKEQLPMWHLLESDRALNKTILTFAHLCTELHTLIEPARRMQLQFIYINEDLCTVSEVNSETSNIGNNTSERLLLKMSGSIEFLCRIHLLIQRFIILGNNLLHQCGVFLDRDDRDTASSLDFKFFNVFDTISELLHQILIFDEILFNSNYCRYWSMYKKTVESFTENTTAVENGTQTEINGLHNSLQELDFLFSGNIFRHFLDSLFALKDKIGSKGVGELIQQSNEYLKQQLHEIDKFHANNLNDFETPQLVRLNAFIVVFHDFCGQIDTRHVKHLLELNVKHQGVMLVSNIAWQPVQFLSKHAETLVKSHEKLLNEAHKQRPNYLQQQIQQLQRDCRTHCVQITLWTLRVQHALANGAFDLKVEQFKELVTLLLLGQRYAGQLSFSIKALVTLHVALRLPMLKSTLLAVCKLIEMLQLIQQTFQAHSENISKIIHCLLQYLQYKILNLLAHAKKRVISAKLHVDHNVDALAVLELGKKCFNGPPTMQRLLVAKLALNASQLNNQIFPSDQQERLKMLVKRIESMNQFQDSLRQICDTNFIYAHQALLTAFLKQVTEHPTDYHSFQYLIVAANSCGKTMDALCGKGNLQLTAALKKSNFDSLRSELISILCAQAEVFLRIEAHSNLLQLERPKPFDQSNNDYRDLLNVAPIEINGQFVVLKDYVENYLSAMFYNLTTISLHDWKTYEKMRHLANTRLLLEPVEDYLPNQTLEQGIDILEIMRNIHIFVSKYVYNMNSQIFVEQHSTNKHLDSIGIRHVANSLRTHGTGVINTTVNFTYQFLRQKFYTFSQFLYDEQIKSRLMKELRSFAERKQSDRYPLYPYERADAFNKDIRKLGLSKDGQTFMDLFRKVITHVGNAMGYIRLVRSGSVNANYSASLFLPKFDSELIYSNICEKQQLDNVTCKAAANFELNINNLVQNFSDRTDYFKLLVEAFQPFFRNPHNLHLKTFFLIVPPLMVNYVEHMLSVKANINKKDHRQQHTVLFDDGFAVGLAYVLKLLDQIGDFNSLQWLTTVREQFDAERNKIKAMLADVNKTTTGNNDGTRLSATSSGGGSPASFASQNSETEKLQQTFALTERRINMHQMEYNLLYYNLSSAKIFFQ